MVYPCMVALLTQQTANQAESTNQTKLYRFMILEAWVLPSNAWISLQMTVETNYAIAIAALSDWLKSLEPVFQPMRSKTETKRTL